MAINPTRKTGKCIECRKLKRDLYRGFCASCRAAYGRNKQLKDGYCRTCGGWKKNLLKGYCAACRDSYGNARKHRSEGPPPDALFVYDPHKPKKNDEPPDGG